MARPKKITRQIQSVEEANAAMKALILAEVELEKVRGAMDLARAAATAQYEGQMDAAKVKYSDLFEALQGWYMGNHKALEMPGRKSVDMLYGVLGRRKGNQTLKLLNRSWTWGAVAVCLRQKFSDTFFHEPKPPEIDKERVREDLTEDQLKAVGLKVEQEERFYAELDRLKAGVL